MKKFEVADIHCGNCANTIKNALSDEFGEISVDLNANPRIVSVDIDDSKIEQFKSELDDLGFSVIREI